MNGEVAFILDWDEEEGEARLSLDDGEREIVVPVAALETYSLAWALTVHRAQGSQFRSGSSVSLWIPEWIRSSVQQRAQCRLLAPSRNLSHRLSHDAGSATLSDTLGRRLLPRPRGPCSPHDDASRLLEA
jgi:hypothetical protein